MFTLLIRTAIIYVLVFCIVRLMGKRQISDMQPFDFVITLFIAELASEPISDSRIPLLYGVIPILTLFILHKTVSFFSLKSQRMRGLMCGHPIIVIEKGVVLERALAALNYTLNDLAEQLRLKDVFMLSDVEYAILETNGSLSVIKKSSAACAPTKPGIILLSDGKPADNTLAAAGLDREWLRARLEEAGIKRFGDCFFAVLEPDGSLHLQHRLKANKKPRTILIDTLRKPK